MLIRRPLLLGQVAAIVATAIFVAAAINWSAVVRGLLEGDGGAEVLASSASSTWAYSVAAGIALALALLAQAARWLMSSRDRRAMYAARSAAQHSDEEAPVS